MISGNLGGRWPRAWVDRARSTVEMAIRPHTGLQNLYRRFGPVCTLGVGPFRYVYLLGPDANRFVFGHSELFSWREAFDALVVVDGETALIVSDGADHQRRRRLVTPAFHRRQIDGYARTMRANADAAIDSWRPGQVVDLYKELRRVIRRSTIEVLFGPRLTAAEPELGRLLQHALAVVDRPPPWQQLQRLGLPAWRRAVAGRAAVVRRVRAEIEYRRSHPDDGARDVLTLLVNSRDADGSGLSDVEIIDQVISLIAAGYETTSAAMSWAAHAVLADAQVWRLARASIAGSGSWRYLDGVVSETLRLHPPAAISVRKVMEPFDFAGSRVPAGSMLIYSPYVTHRLPELWAQPRRFDPQRWDPQQPGYRRPAPHEFLPFGGGAHRCIGATFATVEMTVLLEQLLGRTTLHVESVDRRPVGLAAMRTRSGPHARVQAIE
ncbi:MAG: cytochrome P450 [Pseudonocardiales bacterium]